MSVFAVRKGIVDNLVLIQPAVDDHSFAPYHEFDSVLENVEELHVVWNRNDEVLAEDYHLASLRVPGGANAVGLTGQTGQLAGNGLYTHNMSFHWNIIPNRVGDTIHSEVYFGYTNNYFFTNIFPNLVAGNVQFCG